MKVKFEYPRYMPRLKTKEILYDYFVKRHKPKKIAVEYGISLQSVFDSVNIYQPEIYYDRQHMADRLSVLIKKYGKTNLISKIKMSGEKMNEVLDLNATFTLPKLLEHLQTFDIDYEVRWRYNPEKEWVRVWNGVPMIPRFAIREKVNKREYRKGQWSSDDLSDLVEKGDTTEIMINSEIILLHRKYLESLLMEKGLGIEMRNKILDKVDSIANESALLGIHTERLGKGKQLELSIVKRKQNDC